MKNLKCFQKVKTGEEKRTRIVDYRKGVWVLSINQFQSVFVAWEVVAMPFLRRVLSHVSSIVVVNLVGWWILGNLLLLMLVLVLLVLLLLSPMVSNKLGNNTSAQVIASAERLIMHLTRWYGEREMILV